MKQQYTSANTCLNQIPAAFRYISWTKNARNLDYGGGKYDTATPFLAKKKVKNLVYDPFNRSEIHNAVIKTVLERDPADSATLCNVLNVIKEKPLRLKALREIKKLIKPGVLVFISCYRGRGNTPEKTCNGWQENRPLESYLPEILKVFKNIELGTKMIVASD